MKQFLILISLLFSVSLFSQTVTTTIDVGGSGIPLCVGDSGAGDLNGDYDCKGAPDNANFPNGWLSELSGMGPGTTFYDFADPVPPGNVITNIEITLYNSDCNSSGYVSVEGSNVMYMLTGTTCIPDQPCGNNTVVSSPFPGGLSAADYNYGGMNNFDLMVDAGSEQPGFCFTHADITFTYESAAAAVPTLSQWGMIMLGLIFLIFGVVALKGIERRKVASKVRV